MTIELEEKDTLNPENQPEGDDNHREEDTSKDEGDKTDWKVEAEKWKKTAKTYKEEIETKGIRKELKGNETATKNDYLSKREDILHDFSDEFNKLDEADRSKLKTLLNPALDSIFENATKENRFVARGELQRTVKDLLDYANGRKDREAEIEKARLKGIVERDKMDDAEIRGGSKGKPEDGYTEEIRKLAEEKGWELEEAKVIFENRKKREQEYSVRNRF